MNLAAYLDSSALVKTVRDEVETDALKTFLGDIPAPSTSVLSRVEVRRASLRDGIYDAEPIDELFESLNCMPLTPDVIQRASRLGPPSLKSLDAIHLSTALELFTINPVFVSYDKRLLKAAENIGFRTASPA